MIFYALSSAQFCLRKGDRRTSLAHWMAIFRAFNFSWMQQSCSWLVEKCSSRCDNWLNCPSFLFLKTSDPFIRNTLDRYTFHQDHIVIITNFRQLEKLCQPFFGSLSPAGLSLSQSVLPDQLPESADQIQDILFVFSVQIFSGVCCLFPDLTSWICSNLVKFSSALAKT